MRDRWLTETNHHKNNMKLKTNETLCGPAIPPPSLGSAFLDWSFKSGYGTCPSDIQLALWEAWQAATAWRKINPDDTATMPPLGQLCWLYDPTKGPFIGSRDDVQGDGWLWGQAYGCPWHNGEKWDEDVMQDDDYHVTHWLPLPSLPNAEVRDGASVTPQTKEDVPKPFSPPSC